MNYKRRWGNLAAGRHDMCSPLLIIYDVRFCWSMKMSWQCPGLLKSLDEIKEMNT